MKPIFDRIFYFSSAEPLDGAVQMAIDELLLERVSGVVLRDYTWEEPTTSIGYFGISSETLTSRESERVGSVVRRPTGGGLVCHGSGSDYTYSVIVAADGKKLAPRESYRAIHGILASVLRDFGIAAQLAGESEDGDGSQACFTNPVGDDVMLDGRKIAGAGQKRSRGALLHQGSVQPVSLPDTFGRAFAAKLARVVSLRQLQPELMAEADALADRKYRSRAWTERR